jgi:hypothetical protein
MAEQERQDVPADAPDGQDGSLPKPEKRKEQTGDWQGYDPATLAALFGD